MDDQLQQQQADRHEQQQAEEAQRQEAAGPSVRRRDRLPQEQGHVSPGAAQHLHGGPGEEGVTVT